MIVTAAGNYPRISDGPGGQALRRAWRQFDNGELDWDGVRQVQDDVVRDVVAEQIEAGVDLVTDGLVRWDDAVTYLARGLGAFSIGGLVRYLDTNTFYREPEAQQMVVWHGPITVADWQYAARVSTVPVKAVLTGPFTLARLSRTTVHASVEELAFELADALRYEIRALHSAGADLVQIDEPAIARAPAEWPLFEAVMKRLVQEVDGRVALNAGFGSLDQLPDFFHLPFQVCTLDLIQGPKNWDVLDRIPPQKDVVLGLVDAREFRLESADEIARSVERVARTISAERLQLSPNCGLEFLPRGAAKAKLSRLAEGRRLFQGRGVTAGRAPS